MKKKRVYKSQRRCKCILRFKKCSPKRNCRGKCSGVKCRSQIIKVKKENRDKTSSSQKIKHILQKSKEKLSQIPDPSCDDNLPNFLEVCVFCTIIHFFNSGRIFSNSWDHDTIYEIYTGVIDSLLSIGFIIPLRKFTKEIVRKRLEMLRKLFE